MFEYPDHWYITRTKIDAFGYYDQILERNFSDAELASIFQQLNTWSLPLSLETGVLWLYMETGEAGFREHLPYWQRFEDCGAIITELAMSEPFYFSTKVFKFCTPDEAVEEVADWIFLVRQEYPNMSIVSIEPYPAVTKTEIIWWINHLEAKCRELGIDGIDAFSIDPAWDWGAFSWSDIRDIETHCDLLGISFKLIFWAADAAQAGPGDPDYWWYKGLMSEGEQSRNARVTPNDYVVQSWLYIPRVIIPEFSTTMEFTFTRSVLDFCNEFLL